MNSTNSNKNILFYGNNCNHSAEFINILKKHNMVGQFVAICVNNNKKIPSYIKSVPTIVVNGMNNPVEGEAAFHWLNIEVQRNNSNQSQGQPQGQSGGQPQGQANEGNIEPYFRQEMGGYSDAYSYIDNNKGPIDHSFSFIEGNNVNSNLGGNSKGISTPGDSSSSNKNAGSSLDGAYERMMEQRTNEISGPVKRL